MAYIKCEICSEEKYHAYFSRHLKECHGLTPYQYHTTVVDTNIPKCICGKDRKFKKLSDPYYATCGNSECSSKLQSINLSALNNTEEFQLLAREGAQRRWDTDPEYRKSKREVAKNNLNDFVNNNPEFSLEKSRLRIVSRIPKLAEKYPTYLLYLVELKDNFNDCLKIGVCRKTDTTDPSKSRRLQDYTYYFDEVTLLGLWEGPTEEILLMENDIVVEFYPKIGREVSFKSKETFKLGNDATLLKFISSSSSTIEILSSNIKLK